MKRRDLWQALKDIPGNAAEIGVAEGRFSQEMLDWPINFRRVYMVDRWCRIPGGHDVANAPQEWHEENLRTVLERTAPYGDRAVLLQGESMETAARVPNKSLALVYIDCDHRYTQVMNDIKAWLPKLVHGGIMAFHDYENVNFGVKEAVNEFTQKNHLELHILIEDLIEDTGAYFYWPGGKP